MTNTHNKVLYTGVTNDLRRRVLEHRSGHGRRFTSKYRAGKLVYFEVACDVRSAIEREKQIKGGPRQRKIDLIEGMNPQWRDLLDEALEPTR